VIEKMWDSLQTAPDKSKQHQLSFSLGGLSGPVVELKALSESLLLVVIQGLDGRKLIFAPAEHSLLWIEEVPKSPEDPPKKTIGFAV